MSKGRSLERGMTNRLTGTEIADVMERFSDAAFQIQVYRDLAVARNKLYDATGMWLNSKSYLTPYFPYSSSTKESGYPRT